VKKCDVKCLTYKYYDNIFKRMQEHWGKSLFLSHRQDNDFPSYWMVYWKMSWFVQFSSKLAWYLKFMLFHAIIYIFGILLIFPHFLCPNCALGALKLIREPWLHITFKMLFFVILNTRKSLLLCNMYFTILYWCGAN